MVSKPLQSALSLDGERYPQTGPEAGLAYDAMVFARSSFGSSLPLCFEVSLGPYMWWSCTFCLKYLMSAPSPEGTVSRSICPAASCGGNLRRPRWTTYMSKVDLVVWCRPARAGCQVIMTKFSCFVCASRGTRPDMKPV